MGVLPRLAGFEVVWGAAAGPVDVTPPDTFIDAAPGAVTSDTTPTITYRATDDTSAPAACTFEQNLDGVGWVAAPSGGATNDVTLGPLAPGPHNWKVRAIDEALNVDASPAEVNFTVIVPGGRRGSDALLDLLGLT